MEYKIRLAFLTVFPVPAIEILNRLVKKYNITTMLVIPHSTREILTLLKVDRRISIFLLKKSIKSYLSLIKELIRFSPNIIHSYSGGGLFGLTMLPILLYFVKCKKFL